MHLSSPSRWPVSVLILLSLLGLGRAEELFPTGSTWRYFKGTGEPSTPDATAWRTPGFSDSGWLQGPAAFYYGDPFTGTELTDMRNSYTTLFLRRTFQVGNPSDFRTLALRAACDDGFIAWINGVEVVRFNVPAGELGFTGAASGAVSPDPAVFNDYPIVNPASVLRTGGNLIAVQLFNANLTSSDLVFDASLEGEIDRAAPVVNSVLPTPGFTLRELHSFEVQFSEPVTGVDAADLLVAGVPAAGVTQVTPGQFVFTFDKAPAGNITVAFRPDHGIADQASNPLPFAGGSWSYTIDPNLKAAGLLLNEFLADNEGGIRDEDGTDSDWIEVHNSSNQPAPMSGWSLTDDPTRPRKWSFPDITILPGGYLLVFASEKNRTNATRPLHANFKLSNGGEFLALVNPDGEVESGFVPTYPVQRRGVSYGRPPGAPSSAGYFPKPTPRAANSSGGPGFAPEVGFSERGRNFTGSIQVLLKPTEPIPDTVIRYTLDGSLPTEGSPAYSGPIDLTSSKQIRARAFTPGLLPGTPRTEMFCRLDGTIPTFTSDLPVMVLHNFGKGRPPGTGQQPAYLQVFEPIAGATSLTNLPNLTARVGIGARGSSTLGYEKVSMNLELRDEFDADDNRELLGLPSDSDWVLYAPNNFEPILIHNPLAHQLSRDIGRYSSRTRFVELYLVTDAADGSIRTSTYNGIYVLEERVTRSPDRVDVDKLEPENNTAPSVTGGYLLKVDRGGPGESGFSGARQGIIYVDPSEDEIRLPERAAQRQYLQTYFNAFDPALYGPNWKNPTTGYRAFIDVGAWVDHHILNVLTFNVDALRLSTYFHKPREGKLAFGPLWDFDRALNSTDGRDANPRIWASSGGTDFFNETTQMWWGRLFTDIDFYQEWIDRYQALRQNHFAATNLNRLVDVLANEVRRAQPREQNRWRVIPRGGFQGEINSLKAWLSNRVTFMDSQFVRTPVFSVPEGRFDGEILVNLSTTGPGTIYYTLDGTDPRLPGGGVSRSAFPYGGAPLAIRSNTRFVARVLNESHTARTGSFNPPLISKWSGRVSATYFNRIPNLLLTEIHFHPAEPPAGSLWTADQFEFLEFLNPSSESLNLVGIRIEGGIDYTFSTSSGVNVLAPGQRVLLVRNRAVFESRYPGITGIAGEFTGALDNAANTVRVVGRNGEPISEVRYSDSWAPLADGFGFSLVLRNEAALPTDIDTPDRWRLSTRVGGSPGTRDPAPTPFPALRINEVLAHTDPPLTDSVELHNAGSQPADIGGWWLTDDFREPKKYRIPSGTVINPGGFWVVTEEALRAGPSGFSLSALGDEIHLFSAEASGELTGYTRSGSFGATFNGQSLGWFETSDGREHWVPQSQRTLGQPNAKSAVSPLVITEIHYGPPAVPPQGSRLDEFIEVRNTTGLPLLLGDPSKQERRWRLDGAVAFPFPSGALLGPGAFGVIVSFDPSIETSLVESFRSRFAVPADVPIWGPWTGALNNAGETLRLQQPDEAIPTPAVNAGFVPHVTWESVRYRPTSPWPTFVEGTGNSLQRIRSLSFGNEPANWESAPPTAGRVNSPLDSLQVESDQDTDQLPDDWERANGLDPLSATGANGANGDSDGDGRTHLEEYLAGTNPRDPASRLVIEVATGDSGTELTIPAIPGRVYRIWAQNGLGDTSWIPLGSLIGPATAGPIRFRDPAVESARFYQISITLP